MHVRFHIEPSLFSFLISIDMRDKYPKKNLRPRDLMEFCFLNARDWQKTEGGSL